MKKNSKNGFTLVELLAVIVILAIILVIAVPQVMNVIKDTTKASLESSAKMVAAQVENQYTVAQTLGKEFGDTESCKEDWAGLNDVDYASCIYEIDDDGTAKVTIAGSGKFNGLSVCNATRSSATAIEGECPIETLATHIQDLFENEIIRTSNGLIKDDTDDENIRYAGSNDDVKNYIEFGNTNELWRIIGVFEVETADGDTEELVKIVRDESIGNMGWDSSAGNINSGYGINEWSQADLKIMLNTYYIGNGTSCTYCIGSNYATCSNSCNDVVTPINSTYTSMIESVVWNTGAIEYAVTLTPLQAYSAERGSIKGKICIIEHLCNDSVERKQEWEGKIGLIYPSDWGYASADPDCEDITVGAGTCKQSNWLYTDSSYLTISPSAYSDIAYGVWGVGANVFRSGAFAENGVRPALYLKSNVQIDDGDGSSGNPYKLK